MNDYRDESCLEHMIAACRKMRRIVAGSRCDFDASEEKQLAIERLFEIIGEAAAKISAEFKSEHPDIPWRQATAMRNFVIHDYAGVSIDIMWDTAQLDIPKLLANLLEIQQFENSGMRENRNEDV